MFRVDGAAVTDIFGGQREWEDRAWFPPGPQLAICLSGGKERLADLTDDELLQVAAAARRQTSWAQARELAAIAELTHRRTHAESDDEPGTESGRNCRVLSARESVTEEVAAALTVTGNTAATLVHLAERLTGPLADTGAALETGRIDLGRARVICDVTEQLPDHAAQRVQAAALQKASGQTTGQLRRRIKRIAQRLAPDAIEERRRDAVRQRRLEVWDTASGTTDLALCDLPPEDAHAIFNKITAAANGLKVDGDSRPLHLIRADLATQLLHGVELPDAIHTLLTQADNATAGPGSAPHGAVHARPSDTTAGPGRTPAPGDESGTVVSNDTCTLLAQADATAPTPSARPARVGEPDTGSSEAVRALRGQIEGKSASTPANGAARPQPGSDESTETGEDQALSTLATMVERRLDHVRGRVQPHELPAAIARAAQRIHRQLAHARDSTCQGQDDQHGRPGYRPPPALRRDIETRHATCAFPTCNQPSHRCDLDHTQPWQPGTTCHCNLAPLCRRHHRTKQTPGWKLHQIWPGLLLWTTPSGAWYIVRPERQ